eukprot:COSAG01_NODE_7082_length_3361_cov_1.988964_8_plen_89_part_00
MAGQQRCLTSDDAREVGVGVPPLPKQSAWSESKSTSKVQTKWVLVLRHTVHIIHHTVSRRSALEPPQSPNRLQIDAAAGILAGKFEFG